MIAGALLGVAAHLLFGDTPALAAFIAWVTVPVGQIFLRLIFMVVIPLVVTALILGVAELGDVRRLGRVGARTLLFTVILSAVSVVIGVLLANVVRPGEGISPETRAGLLEIMGKAKAGLQPPPQPKSGPQILLDLIPENPVEAMTRAFKGEMLAVMVFSLVLGVALTLVEREVAEPFLRWLEALYAAVMKVIGLAMLLAPYGVGALLFTLTASFGAGILQKLLLYMATVLFGLLLHQFVTYPLVLRFFAGLSPLLFF